MRQKTVNENAEDLDQRRRVQLDGDTRRSLGWTANSPVDGETRDQARYLLDQLDVAAAARELLECLVPIGGSALPDTLRVAPGLGARVDAALRTIRDGRRR